MTTSNELLDAVRTSMLQNTGGNWYAKICDLHQLGETVDSHNCIACNLAELVEILEELATDFDKFTKETTAKVTYLLWLYLLTERMQEIFRLISFPEEMKNQKFPMYLLTKKWGNFIKHPKAFFLTHHASFDRETVDDKEIKIDNCFINKFYSGDKKNGELYKILTNQKKVVVLLPNLVELTNGLGEELVNLSSIIRNNPIYAEIMTNKSVLEHYYSSPQVADSNLS